MVREQFFVACQIKYLWKHLPVKIEVLLVSFQCRWAFCFIVLFHLVLFFCFWFQVLQRRYPNLALVTDHLLGIFIDLAGDKYQASEHSAAGSSQVPEPASESRSEHKKPNLEGRELSLRLSLIICFLEVS